MNLLRSTRKRAVAFDARMQLALRRPECPTGPRRLHLRPRGEARRQHIYRPTSDKDQGHLESLSELSFYREIRALVVHRSPRAREGEWSGPQRRGPDHRGASHSLSRSTAGTIRFQAVT